MTENRDLEAYSADYQELPFERVVEKFRRRAVKEFILKSPARRLLEVGCGFESIFSELPKEFSGVVVEPIAELLNRQALGSNVELFHGVMRQFATTCPIKFEAIVLSSLLHEVENPTELLDNVKSVLQPRGELLVVVPNETSIHRILGVYKGLIRSTIEFSKTQNRMQQKQVVYSSETLRERLTVSGFKVLQVLSFFPKLSSHEVMQSLIDSGRMSEEFLENLFLLSDVVDPLGSELLAVCELAV